jgi:phosphoglycolate phosphatase-like HAD superfamily hydrolase
MLVLFDIDMTMISTGGSGMKAMVDAGRELFGAGFTVDRIDFAGRLDPLIIGDMLAANGVMDNPQRRQQFRAAYRNHLERRLAVPGIGRALPGVQELLDALGQQRGVTLGLLTGNFEETGSMKLRACGIDPERFAVRVWGDESPHDQPRRDHLVPLGIARAVAHRGEPISSSTVTVVGDTPHDVQCARQHGCRSLGVATGSFGADQLRAAGATHVVSDLSETQVVISWLVSATPLHAESKAR